MPPADHDDRIAKLNDELRQLRHNTANAENSVNLKLTEIQLNLANQDKTLGKLDACVVGNGKPGLMQRMDRVEQTVGGMTKAGWIVASIVATTLIGGAVIGTARVIATDHAPQETHVPAHP